MRFEAVDESLKAGLLQGGGGSSGTAKSGVQISRLTKKFGSKKVVEDLCVEMYEGQILALLGHNGAGKTTTISMLTGMIAPSSGTAHICGHDIRTEMSQVRGVIGMCPQHDVLWPTLTVRQHLELFGELKGVRAHENKEEIDGLMRDVEVLHQANVPVSSLNGGAKRKLSVAMALIGGSKVIFLDEPTSGVDVAARRSFWGVLKRWAVGRTMVITTHFMEEADALGDRVAIMSDGKLECCGSPQFLKKNLGTSFEYSLLPFACN
jgi:ABC-type multidrug transport system ATPase subunit